MDCFGQVFRKPKEYTGGHCAIKRYREVDNETLMKIFEQRICRIFEVAKYKKEDVLILGAFGCGAFRNSPYVVASAFRKVVDYYLYDFQVIEFAIFSKGDQL